MSVQNPIPQFIEEMNQHGRSERTLEAYDRVLTQYREFLVNNRDKPPDSAIQQATREDCLAWVHTLRGEYSESTVASYGAYIHRFYRYMTEIETLEGNPMTLVMEGMDEQINSDPTRRDISIDQLREFITEINHPLHRAIIVLFAKTGIRVGELVNLDLRDLNLNQIDLDETFNALPRGQLVGRGSSLYVSAEPTKGESTNGEVRGASNKRERDTIIPIDEELEHTLLEWLLIRPRAQSPAEPLFVSTKSNWGQRLSTMQVRHIVVQHASERGWYEGNAEPGENVTPHYFRHFFTTYLRDRTGDRGIVKYLRGDVADDVIDTYTHNWGDRVRSEYNLAIYSLL